MKQNRSIGTALVLLTLSVLLVLIALLAVTVINRLPEWRTPAETEAPETEASAPLVTETDAPTEAVTASETARSSESPALENARAAAADGTLRDKLADGSIDVWRLFDEAVILGDARAVDFSRYGFVDADRVFADDDDTVNAIAAHIPAVQALQPKFIFLCYGLNDVSSGSFQTPEEYAAKLVEMVSQLNVALPEATVVVSSILPVGEQALAETATWENLSQFSATVESTCVEFGLRFANNDQLVRDHADLYGSDGIRFQQDFYPLLAANLFVAALS